jgi:hypothetical protein
MAADLLTFTQAANLGRMLHDRCIMMGHQPPLPRNDMGWGDLVQFAVRMMNEGISKEDLDQDGAALTSEGSDEAG